MTELTISMLLHPRKCKLCHHETMKTSTKHPKKKEAATNKEKERIPHLKRTVKAIRDLLNNFLFFFYFSIPFAFQTDGCF